MDCVAELHEADIGEIIRVLSPDQQRAFVQLLGKDFNFLALTEIDEVTRLRLLEALTPSVVAKALEELESDDAVSILENLDTSSQKKILSRLPLEEQIELKRAFAYPESAAGRLMQTQFVAIPVFWTIGQTIDYVRENKDMPDAFYHIYVVSADFKLLGDMALARLLRQRRHVLVRDVMNEACHTVNVLDDREEIAYLFERYNLISAPVIDEARSLLGVITVDDIVDVIQEETEEDFRALAGVGDEELSDTVAQTLRSRFLWLVVNLGTAILASVVINIFEGTIAHLVALAVLMPIVASMGGNAGTQTMTVAVRAIARGELDRYNTWRIIRKEVFVGALNGALFAGLIGVIAGLWFTSPQIGLVIGCATLLTLIAAALAGILIPVGLDRLGVDPAISSGVCLTTVTDIVGFFSFLALASWWFEIPF
jgi:magnesium transporter